MASDSRRAQNQLRKPFIFSGFVPKNCSRAQWFDHNLQQYFLPSFPRYYLVDNSPKIQKTSSRNGTFDASIPPQNTPCLSWQLPFLRVATFKLPRKSYTYNAVSEGTPRKILGGFLIHTWAWVRVSDLMVGLSEIIVIPRKLIELWWSSTISLHNWFQNLWFTCASQLEWKRSQYWLL